MHSETMTVTPDLAERWLRERNKRNRVMSKAKVSSYARDIASGNWHQTHQNSIAFYNDGNLADGQHRLAAIVESNTSLDLVVWWGLSDKSAFGIDAHKMRKTADQIKIAGMGEWIGANEIACARMMPGARTSNRIYTPQEIVDFCNEHEYAIRFSIDHLKSRIGGAPIRAAVAVAVYHENEYDLRQWCNIMDSGIGTSSASRTVLTLRDRILRDRGLKSGAEVVREYLLRVAMRSIKGFCEGEVLTKIYEPKERIYTLPAQPKEGE